MHSQKVIERFGYKPNEAKVYLAALNLGECTVSQIATKINLPRTSVQVILEKLHSEGLINFYIKKRYKYWVAEKPEKFLIQLEEKQQAFKAALPEIKAMMKGPEEKPQVKVYMGTEDLKLVYSDILETKHDIKAIIPFDEWQKMLGEDYMNTIGSIRASHFLKLTLLVPQSDNTQVLKDTDSKELRCTRFLPPNMQVDDVMFIYANKVALISLNKNLPTAVLIEDVTIKNTISILFDYLWDRSN